MTESRHGEAALWCLGGENPVFVMDPSAFQRQKFEIKSIIFRNLSPLCQIIWLAGEELRFRPICRQGNYPSIESEAIWPFIGGSLPVSDQYR